MSFVFKIERELYLEAQGSGSFFAKKGAMVADTGGFKYEKRLLGAGGNIATQAIGHVVRKFTGENLELMEVKGQGVVYLADQEAHVTIINLNPQESISVESEDLLAFTDTCKYGVTPVGVGIFSQKGLFMSKLTATGQGAQVVIKTKGNPLDLTVGNGFPIRVDPDALVAWTGKAPKVKTSVNWKTFIGQTSGESYMFEFTEPNQTVIIQPYERESGVKFGIDDNRYQPEMQSSAFQNTFHPGGVPHGQPASPQGQQGQGLSGMIGNFLNR